MNDKTKSCAPADNQQASWDGIDWTRCELAVRKLQARIVKAQKEGRHGKVKALQWTLTHSFAAKALAVKRVTSNSGSNTAGVDKVTWETPQTKYQAIWELKRRGYQPKPLRRIHIKKSNGKLRPLGIPTMKDRARHPFLRLPKGTLHDGRSAPVSQCTLQGVFSEMDFGG